MLYYISLKSIKFLDNGILLGVYSNINLLLLRFFGVKKKVIYIVIYLASITKTAANSLVLLFWFISYESK